MSLTWQYKHPIEISHESIQSEPEVYNHIEITIDDESASKSIPPLPSLKFYLTRLNSIGFPKFFFILLIFAVLVLSHYVGLNLNDDEYYIRNFESSEIYVLNCSCLTEMIKEGKGNSTDIQAVNDLNNYTIIIIDQDEQVLNFIMMSGNFSQLYLSDFDKEDFETLKTIMYVIVYAELQTGKIISLEFPDHVSSEYMKTFLPYIKTFLIDKSQLGLKNNEERLLYPNLPSIKTRSSIKETETSIILGKVLENDNEIPATIESEGNKITTLIKGVSTKSSITQSIGKTSRRLESAQMKSSTLIDAFSSGFAYSTTINLSIQMKIKKSDQNIEKSRLDRAKKYIAYLNLETYTESLNNFTFLTHDSQRRNTKEVLLKVYKITDIFGKVLSERISINDLQNETSNFVKVLKLDDFFEWKLCEGTFDNKTAERVKKVYQLKNYYEKTINDLNIKMTQTVNNYFTVADFVIYRNFKSLSDLNSLIQSNFDTAMNNLIKKRTEYRYLLRKGESSSFVPDTYKQIFGVFNTNCNNNITSYKKM